MEMAFHFEILNSALALVCTIYCVRTVKISIYLVQQINFTLTKGSKQILK